MAFTSAFTGAQIDAAISAAGDGASKASFSYDQAAPAVEASVNISGITDNAVGNFTPTFTSGYADVFYRVMGGTTAGNAVRGGNFVGLDTGTNLFQDARATGSFIGACSVGSSGSSDAVPQDRIFIMFDISGTLA